MQAYRGMETKQPGIALVVALHALVIWTLWTGLSRTAIDRIRPPMEAVTVQDLKPPEPETRPLPPVKLVTVPQVVVPVQDVVIDSPPDAPRITQPMNTDPVMPANDPAAGGRGGEPARTLVRREFKPASRVEPGYPRQALRDGMEGFVVARLHVAANGSVGQVEIVSSSHRAFDREVVRALSQWRFTPEPVGFIAEYQINFRLKD